MGKNCGGVGAATLGCRGIDSAAPSRVIHRVTFHVRLEVPLHRGCPSGRSGPTSRWEAILVEDLPRVGHGGFIEELGVDQGE